MKASSAQRQRPRKRLCCICPCTRVAGALLARAQEPRQLLEAFAQAEEANLFLIQAAQEAEEGLEGAAAALSAAQRRLGDEAAVLRAQVHLTGDLGFCAISSAARRPPGYSQHLCSAAAISSRSGYDTALAAVNDLVMRLPCLMYPAAPLAVVCSAEHAAGPARGKHACLAATRSQAVQTETCTVSAAHALGVDVLSAGHRAGEYAGATDRPVQVLAGMGFRMHCMHAAQSML